MKVALAFLIITCFCIGVVNADISPKSLEVRSKCNENGKSLENTGISCESAIPMKIPKISISEGRNKDECEKGSKLAKWIGAMASTVVVSLISLIGIILLPINRPMGKRGFEEWLLPFLVAFAVGSLLGSAILHLLPDAFGLGDHPESPTTTQGKHKVLWIGLTTLLGIFLFFVCERLIGHIQGHVPHYHNDHSDPHYYHFPSSPSYSRAFVLDEHVALVVPRTSKKHASGYLILFADAIHNLTDGFAIGAAFASSFSVGIAITFAVIMHEIPQELGDFAILVSSGFSKFQALLWNFMTALTCVGGAVVGLLIGTSSGFANDFILAAVAGGFIYIALAGMIHNLLYVSNVGQTVSQSLAMLLGFFVMFAVNFWLEDFHFCVQA